MYMYLLIHCSCCGLNGVWWFNFYCSHHNGDLVRQDMSNNTQSALLSQQKGRGTREEWKDRWS